MAGKQGLTYSQVEKAVNKVAGHVASLDGDVIAIVAERSYEMVLAILGILKAGKAYCPIEPDTPVSRVEAMQETAKLRHVLVPASQEPYLVHGMDWQVMYVSVDGYVTVDALDPSSTPVNQKVTLPTVRGDTVAYVLFTSGSTGKPKGCSVPHRGSVNYVRAVLTSANLDSEMRFMLKTPYIFDVSVQDIFTCFAAQGTLVVAPHDAHKDPGEICDLIEEEKVDVCCFVPTLLVSFVNHLESNPTEVPKALKRVLTIGEALMADTCKRLCAIKDVEIHNLYGPTECSVGVSHFHASVAALGDNRTVAPIGLPFDYTSFHIFDPSKYEEKQISEKLLSYVKDGEIGELFIGGDCIAKGYVNDETKTAEAFFNIPSLCPFPPNGASPFTLYKTGDLVAKRGGTYEYLGRNDFQVKVNGVRIECEEVQAVLKGHKEVQDCMVTVFGGPFGPALVAYVVVNSDADWTEQEGPEETSLVAAWGEVYNEMYATEDGIAEQDPTLNWSGYTDTYSRLPHTEAVVAEWVHWCCELVLRHGKKFDEKSLVTELGCGNGMLLFRIAPALPGKYIGTDISTAALEYVEKLKHLPKFEAADITTASIAAHETLTITDKRSNTVVLCNGVTMYFPSAEYLCQCIEEAAEATAEGGIVIFGDIQSKRHLDLLHRDVAVFQGLDQPGSVASEAVRTASRAAGREQLSYFDDGLFAAFDADSSYFPRAKQVGLRIKRGWHHSEFTRFRYDTEFVIDSSARKPLPAEDVSYVSFDEFAKKMGVPADPTAALSSKVVATLPSLCKGDGVVVVTVPNARLVRIAALSRWLEANADKPLNDVPSWLRPQAAHLGNLQSPGVEPEAIFEMKFPDGWTQSVVWSAELEFMDIVLLSKTAAGTNWLSGIQKGPYPTVETAKNQNDKADARKACNEGLKAFAMRSSLLPAMRPAVYVAMDTFPLNGAGKLDRKALPDARKTFEDLSDASALSFVPPETEDERKMASCWEEVLNVPVGIATPFRAYGGHSLISLQLCSVIFREFGKRPDLPFLMQDACTVRGLLVSMSEATVASNAIVSLSMRNAKPRPILLILGAAGNNAQTYASVAEFARTLDVYAFDLPGRGSRIDHEPLRTFKDMLEHVLEEVSVWAKGKSFYIWGDSLGATVGYELTRALEKRGIHVLGLLVSGNAGPVEAGTDPGMGKSASTILGREVNSVDDMTQEDWLAFLMASVGDKEKAQLKKIQKDTATMKTILDPLIADCEVYETYKGPGVATRLAAPIYCFRGSNDAICNKSEMQSWEKVAAQWNFWEIEGAGHSLTGEFARKLALNVQFLLLAKQFEDTGFYTKYRKGYIAMNKTGQAVFSAKDLREGMMSPTMAARARPKLFDVNDDFSLGEIEMKVDDVIEGSVNITPQTKSVRAMRAGNLQWRVGNSRGMEGQGSKSGML
jgi:amino acid adenylation domain-containing protein